MIVALAAEQVPAGSEIYFKDQKHSLTRWEQLDPNRWLSFDEWRKKRSLKDKQPSWETILQEKRLREIMGRVVECRGDCRLYRGQGFNKTGFRSSVREGDEYITLGDSYAWIYLMDGSLVRISPDSSVTFKEFNVGKKEFFIHVRVNSGNVLFMSRNSSKLKESSVGRETDQIFLPLTFYQANPSTEEPAVKESDLFELLDDSNENQLKVQRLNKLIEENNEAVKDKKTFAFLVLPNGTITGYDLNVEMIVLLGNKSFIKQRSSKWQGYEKEAEAPGTFYFRGFENSQSFSLDVGTWLEVDVSGRSILPAPQSQRFAFGEILSKRPYSILIARELLFPRYSQVFHNTSDPKELAETVGYRLWGELGRESKDDLQKRLNYLHEYTRRIETSNLLSANQFKRKIEQRGEDIERFEYSNRFYNTALNHYIRRDESSSQDYSDREVLNSTTKNLWKRMHGIR